MKLDTFYPAECVVFPAGAERMILRNRNTGSVYELPVDEVRLFLSLLGLRSIDQHIEELVYRTFHQIPLSALRQMVDRWIENGMLRPVNLLLPADGDETARKRELETAIVITDDCRDMPELVASFSDHADFSSRSIPLLVYFYSELHSEDETEVPTTESRSSDYSGNIHYKGTVKREGGMAQLVSECEKEKIDPALLWFALGVSDEHYRLRSMAGLCNTALLSSCERNILLWTDSASYEALRRRGTRDTLCIRPQDGFLLPDGDACVDSSLLENSGPRYDLPGAVNMYLGKRLSVPEDGSVDAESIPSSIAREIERGTARIGAICIDTGHRTSSGNCAQDLFSSKNSSTIGYGTDLDDLPTIVEGWTLQSGVIALSGEFTVPPFFPSDNCPIPVFGTLLRQCIPGLYVVRLPAGTRYERSGKAAVSPSEHPNSVQWDDCVHQLVVENITRDLLAAAAEDRIMETGVRYTELSSLSASDFYEYIHDIFVLKVARRVEELRGMLEMYQGPSERWRAEIISLIDRLHPYTRNPDINLSGDFQSRIGTYGRLLQVWPDIYRIARSL